ncbi:hypothetical protein BKM15_26020 [Pseudomonas syringae pv. syringae]|nr:hypothetical protein BKM15_26020 [Pseudomonas syringae pv. syringae]
MNDLENPLEIVYTSREAAELYGLSENTVTQWCNRGRFTDEEARKSSKVWLVTKKGMERLTNKEEKKLKIALSTNPTVEKYLGLALEHNSPFEYNHTTFENIKRLYDFVVDNSEEGFIFEEVLKEVIDRAAVQGGPSVSYELGSHETKSGHAESISFDYDSEYEEDEDTYTSTIIF